MSPSKFKSRKPHEAGVVAALAGAEASARNCGAASCGRAKGAGLGKLAGSGETAPEEAEVD
jgi:hypothetical protein